MNCGSFSRCDVRKVSKFVTTMLAQLHAMLEKYLIDFYDVVKKSSHKEFDITNYELLPDNTITAVNIKFLHFLS